MSRWNGVREVEEEKAEGVRLLHITAPNKIEINRHALPFFPSSPLSLLNSLYLSLSLSLSTVFVSLKRRFRRSYRRRFMLC